MFCFTNVQMCASLSLLLLLSWNLVPRQRKFLQMSLMFKKSSVLSLFVVMYMANSMT